MSRQNKAAARKRSGTYGRPGPAKTTPKHGKAHENRIYFNKTVEGRMKETVKKAAGRPNNDG